MAEMALTEDDDKKFLAGFVGILYLCAIGITGYVRFFPEYFMNQEYPMWVHQKEVVTTSTRQQQRLVVLGDSRAKAGYQPAQSEFQTINLSLGGISPVGSYYVLKKYLARAPAPEKLVLSFSPFVLLETNQFRRLFWERPVKFSRLDPNDLAEIFHNTKRLGDETFGNLAWHSFRFALPDKAFGDLLAGSFFMRARENHEIYQRLKTDRGHTFFGVKDGSSEDFKEIAFDTFVPSKMLQHYLAETIDLARRSQIEVYWYTMPFNKSSGEALSASFRSGFDEFLNDLSARRGVTIINGITFLDDREFGDPSHLHGGVQQVSLDLLLGVGLVTADP